jgi:NDP-sugar pyrophosphorylase family protein
MDNIPKQVVIMAGGFGSRLSSEVNPMRCKSLIELGGQTLIGHLIDSLKEVGITHFILKTSSHSHNKVKEILETKDLQECRLIEGDAGFRETPYLVKDLLDDRFLFICGHQIITANHLKSMLEKSRSVTNVISIYNNAQYPMNKERRILYDNRKFQRVSVSDPGLSYNHWYARNPYIIQKEIAQMIHDDNYSKTFSYYMFRLWETHGCLDGIYADMPPEFDYDHEFAIAKDFFIKHKLS